MRRTVVRLDERVGGGGRDAAVVVPVARDLNVPELSPRAAPRVLHEPVVAALLLRAVPHHQHPVVELGGGTVLIVVDPAGVELEGVLRGVDGDGDRSHCSHRLHQLLLIPLRYVHEAHIISARVLGVVPALVVDGLVGVGLLRVDAAIVLDVLEGVVHEAAVAPVVPVRARAVHQVLLRERHQVPGLPEVLPLQRSRGAEGPAAAALALVLDLGDGALLAPVHLVRVGDVRRGDERRAAHFVRLTVQTLVVFGGLVETVHGLHELVMEHVSVLVLLETVRDESLLVPLVVLSYHVLVLSVYLHTKLIFHFVVVYFPVLELESVPFLLHKIEEGDCSHSRYDED